MKFSLLKKHRNDIILISVVLIIAVVGWLLITLNKTEGGYAVVVIDGEETASYPLNRNTEVRLTFRDDYNILVIEDGAAHIESASCPDKLCVMQEEVRYNGETLVCLPNKTTVKIVSQVDSEIDLIS